MYSKTVPRDAFYTSDVSAIYNHISKSGLSNRAKEYTIIEPSCGSGEFLKLSVFNKTYDLTIDKQVIDKHKNIIFKQIDFLTTEDKDAVYIGNPPFGINNKLAINFCRHCCALNAKYICFILPASFNKQSIQTKAFRHDYRLISSHPYNSFHVIIGGKTKNKNINCVFQIWKHENGYIREIINDMKTTNKYFKYIKHSDIDSGDESIYSIRRVGSKTPELTHEIHPSHQDHYYIRFDTHVDTEIFISKYNKISFTFDDCTKQKNITKGRLNYIIDNEIAPDD